MVGGSFYLQGAGGHRRTREILGLGSRHPSDAAGFGLAILQERLRDIIPVARTLLVRIAPDRLVDARSERVHARRHINLREFVN